MPTLLEAALGLLEQLQLAVGSTYAIERELGGGGMSRVFVAEETALDRRVVIKVLPPEFFESLSLERFRREIRVAARLQHPHVVPVLTAGEAGGIFYYTTPYVDGENLRNRLDRERQLSIADAVRLTCDVAEALAHAHAAGIIHRDIKPENILLSGSHALLTDFGIAKAFADAGSAVLTSTGVSIGTPRYMAPEQASGAADVDARADIYALACVLYELLTGQPPFSGASAQAVVAQHFTAPFPHVRHSRPDVPLAVDAALRKATAKAPADRYATVDEFAQALRSAVSAPKIDDTVHATSTPGRIARRIGAHGWSVAIGLVVIVLSAVAAFRGLANPTLTNKDTILLADFVNRTGDSVFDGTLKQAIAVQLRQSPFLNLFPDEGVTETLKLMERAPGERVSRAIGREICQRQALKAMIIGTITNLGPQYVITLEAISAGDGRIIASRQAVADGKAQVLHALQQSTTALRRDLGESLNTIEKYNAPIEQATTSSLPALSVYSNGLERIYRGDSRGALSFFTRAVELDSSFASAYGWLAWTYANLGAVSAAATAAEKAFALRDRATEIERLHIIDLYHIWATADWEKQFDNDTQLQALYPNDWMSYNNLAIGYFRIGQPDKAIAQAREGIRVNPNEVHLYWHGSNALIRLNRFDEARAIIQQGQAQKLDHPWYRQNLFAIAFVLRDTASLRGVLASIRDREGEREALLAQSRAAMFDGRWREAQAFLQQADALGGRSIAASTASTLPSDAALRASLFNGCGSAERNIPNALSTSRIASPRQVMLVPITTDGALCGDARAAERLADEQARRYPRSVVVNAFSVPFIRAAIALQEGHADGAIDALGVTTSHETASVFLPNYLRGQAYLRQKNGTQAAAEFQKIIDHRGWDPLSPLYPLAYVGLAQASALLGDRIKSRMAYESFFVFWKDADASIPIVAKANAEYAALK